MVLCIRILELDVFQGTNKACPVYLLDRFTINSSDVAGLDDFVRLITDVQNLANDVAETRAYLNAILKQLKGQTG